MKENEMVVGTLIKCVKPVKGKIKIRTLYRIQAIIDRIVEQCKVCGKKHGGDIGLYLYDNGNRTSVDALTFLARCRFVKATEPEEFLYMLRGNNSHVLFKDAEVH